MSRGERPTSKMRIDFALAFTAALKDKQIGVREIARRIPTSPSSIVYYKQGQRMPGYNHLYRICEILDKTPDEVLGYHKKPRQTT